jgi:hypothetical protein
MQRSIPWLWIVLAGLLLLAPGPAGRLFLNLLSGLTLLALLVPVVLGLSGFVGWWWLRSRLKPCSACGVSSLAVDVCPVCGQVKGNDSTHVPELLNHDPDQYQASEQIVDVVAVDADVSASSDSGRADAEASI